MNGISSQCLCSLALLLSVALHLATGQQSAPPQQQPGNLPIYVQSPFEDQEQQANVYAVREQQNQLNTADSQNDRRQNIPMPAALQPRAALPLAAQAIPANPSQVAESGPAQFGPPKVKAQSNVCIYDKKHFAKFDECLAHRPYPTVGLPAFKNDDLLVKGAKSHLNGDKRGCLFTLSNGLFKNYQITSYSIDSDTQCLDAQAKLPMSIEFANATLYYLWQLRCLNYADQLLDDATLNGKLGESLEAELQQQQDTSKTRQRQLCAGSSQTIGFASLQLSNIEAQVELAMDIYKNWRVTNVTLAFARPTLVVGNQHQQQQHAQPPSSIRDFTFESLDGDELNWRHLQSFSNWTRNRLHTNFLEQFRRFVWISLQRCLSESSDKLPVKLFDLFANHKYN